jgi:hypothetical protein
MNFNRTRAEMIRILQRAAAGKLKPEDLSTGTIYNITLHLDDLAWYRPDGSRWTIQEKEEEARQRGARFVTLDLG